MKLNPKVFREAATQDFSDFGKDILAFYLDRGRDFFEDEESLKIIPILERHGLIEEVKFDPEKHAEYDFGFDPDEGDAIYIFTEKAMGANK